MEKKIYPLNDKNRKSVMIADGTVYISSNSYKDFDKFYGSVTAEKKLLSLESVTSFALSDISKVVLPIESTDLTIYYYSSKKGKDTDIYLAFNRKQDAEELARRIAFSNQFSTHQAQMKPWDAIQSPLVGIFMTCLLGGLIYYDARELEHGNLLDYSGSRAWFKQLLGYFAEKLGTMGTAIIMGMLLAYFAYRIYKKLQNPPMEYIFE